MREALRVEAELAGAHDMPGFIAAMRERVRANAPDQLETFAQAAPFDHLWLGLDRWRSKFGG